MSPDSLRWKGNFVLVLFFPDGAKESEPILLGRVPLENETIHMPDGTVYAVEHVTHLANRNPMTVRCFNSEESCHFLAAPVAFISARALDSVDFPEFPLDAEIEFAE